MLKLYEENGVKIQLTFYKSVISKTMFIVSVSLLLTHGNYLDIFKNFFVNIYSDIS